MKGVGGSGWQGVPGQRNSMPGGPEEAESPHSGAWLVVGMKGQASAPELSSSWNAFPTRAPLPR